MDTELREKIERVFGALAVNKQEATQPGLRHMPRFVAEFLLAGARTKNPAISLAEVRDKIMKFSVDADGMEDFKSRLMREKEVRVIGLVEVEARLDRGQHTARLATLPNLELQVSDALVNQYRELLDGGLWGTAVLRYDTSTSKRQTVLEAFTPYQLTQPDMSTFRKAREKFTLDEWIDLLITSAGYRPSAFVTPRLRLLVLCRLIPLTQSNLYMIELGHRGTGKSYLLRSLSKRAYLLAGGSGTKAKLVYDNGRKQIGIIGRKKVVIFDEISDKTAFNDKELVGPLKDYMESGNLACSGSPSIQADCSFVFAGNLDLDVEGLQPSGSYRHLFDMLPTALNDAAIAERIHGFLPGWEMPKIPQSADLADGVGLVSDYFGEVLGELRKEVVFEDYVARNVTFHGSAPTGKTAMSGRDENAIRQIASGLLKLLYPDMNIEPEGLEQVKQVAVELRQRVHNQLSIMAPGEFPPKILGFSGMKPHEAKDFGKSHPIEAQDVAANLQAQVGKITILLVSERGGGDVGFVECSHVAGSGYGVSGLRGAALKESVQAAYDALLELGSEFGLPADRLRQARMAVHLVNIAEPKDGPSAGLAFALAMLSAATKRAIVPGLAVTGELSIHGNVNKVGGVVEKLAAAKRHQRKIVIIPASNAGELARLPDLHAGLDVRPVHTLAEAVKIALTA